MHFSLRLELHHQIFPGLQSLSMRAHAHLHTHAHNHHWSCLLGEHRPQPETVLRSRGRTSSVTVILNKTNLNLASDGTKGQLETQNSSVPARPRVPCTLASGALLWPAAAPEGERGTVHHRVSAQEALVPAVLSSSTGPLLLQGAAGDSELPDGPLQSGSCTLYPNTAVLPSAFVKGAASNQVLLPYTGQLGGPGISFCVSVRCCVFTSSPVSPFVCAAGTTEASVPCTGLLLEVGA